MNRLPAWFKQNLPDTDALERMHLLSRLNINTVCKEAKCPNINYCFKNRKFTFLISGNTCTRSCRFCGVNRSEDTALSLDKDEPYRISSIVKALELNYVVITSVTRDDLEDGGAAHFAQTIELIRAVDERIKIEALIPDFFGNIASLKAVIDSRPHILAHNIETVRRLYKDLRPKADYQLSLDLLRRAKEISPVLITKSSLMLGLGETEAEVVRAMEDLRRSQCDILTLGQYLAPSEEHYPVREFISIAQFDKYRYIGLDSGFRAVSSGPCVRSSYQAEEIQKEAGYV